MTRVTPDMTIAEAQPILREEGKNGGTHCPLCSQRVQVYKRTITAQMAYALILLYRRDGWATWPELLDNRRGDEAKLRYWSLVECVNGSLWRVTELGRQFVEGAATVPKFALVYNSRVLGFEGEPVTIHDALGNRFDLAELMSA